jgi:hypothetical protein
MLVSIFYQASPHVLQSNLFDLATEIGLFDSPAGIGSNIPKVASTIIKKLRSDITRLIVNQLKTDIIGEKMVLPNMEDFPIPYFTEKHKDMGMYDSALEELN